MTVRPLHPEDCLRLAATLAGEGAGRGRPRTLDLRRSVSTSYYAVFHELTGAAVAELGSSGVAAGRDLGSARRWLAHAQLARLAQAALGGGAAPLRAVLLPVDARLDGVARDFLLLQAAREQADYDDDFDVDKATALVHVTQARRAVRISRELQAAAEPSYRLFLRLMVGAVGIAKQRSSR